MGLPGRAPHRIALVEAYLKAQGLWHDADAPEPRFTDLVELDLATVQPSLAGPKRPQDRVALKDAAPAFKAELAKSLGVPASGIGAKAPVSGANYELVHAHVSIPALPPST